MVNKGVCTTVDEVCEDLQKRASFGLNKYGVTLTNSGLSQRQLLQHAYEEALDLANYLKTTMNLLDKKDEKQEEMRFEQWDGYPPEHHKSGYHMIGNKNKDNSHMFYWDSVGLYWQDSNFVEATMAPKEFVDFEYTYLGEVK